eukprot:CAMPEP_0174731522 /NCGR_PEP_ID=MMETSP1094-20130205/57700_1 /TAXON_ID=156173 /ORGANISM="Chrysochromulina brevifilum, Strain UTEX LB 985" /LENGTH=104 /DNA_ID=CAMNT_0015933909 /DNA_START=298 /DNA_END=612 /DNA_ORIENTATION=-
MSPGTPGPQLQLVSDLLPEANHCSDSQRVGERIPQRRTSRDHSRIVVACQGAGPRACYGDHCAHEHMLCKVVTEAEALQQPLAAIPMMAHRARGSSHCEPAVSS